MTAIELSMIDRAVEDHAPSAVFALFSGGHDSVCALRVAVGHPLFRAAVFIDTGTGLPETREYVHETARALGVPLLEYRTPPEVYESMVLEHGFPGPAQHLTCYSLLKERRLRQLTRDHKQGPRDRIVLVSGVRREESTRRMGTAEEVRRDGSRVFVNPIIDWKASDRLPFMERHGIAPSPVVANIHRSGECNCGAFAAPGELDELAFWYPSFAARMRDLERRVFERHPHAARWGERPGMPVPPEQAWLPLCQSCPTRWEVPA
jgi:3'-phosphoadenosine 5'-phosphosulfate sulfotransferase (PAPS reductase)/FAD synthetase